MNHSKDKFEERELEVQEQIMELMGLALFALVLIGSFMKVMFF